MSLQELSRETDGLVRQFEYDGATTYALDLGRSDGSVDLLDDTAIVVVDGEEFDVDVPEGADVQAFIKNGVLSIEVIEE